MRRSLVFCLGIAAIAIGTGAFFFFGTDVERSSAQFLFSKLSFLTRGAMSGGGSILKNASGAAAIIFRPPSIPYDQIIIDRGERDGVRIGARVFALPDIFVGSVSEVFWDSSRVISPTSFGHETDVVLERTGTAIPAVGYGNRELRMRLPRDFEIFIEDRIVLPGAERYVIGDVVEVVGESTGAVKEARVRQRLNDWTMLTVYVEP